MMMTQYKESDRVRVPSGHLGTVETDESNEGWHLSPTIVRVLLDGGLGSLSLPPENLTPSSETPLELACKALEGVQRIFRGQDAIADEYREEEALVLAALRALSVASTGGEE